ncbi:hypothetical protein VI03_30090 [Burkholderia vietnamiensis]|nr:hypothetical protein VI03_30090 [Burkholderia vietnamiensis]TPQ46849.1 hypothetical protein C2U71_06700 [Burkholderia ubonensis]
MLDRRPIDHFMSSLIVSTAVGGLSLMVVVIVDSQFGILKYDGLGVRCMIAMTVGWFATCLRLLLLRTVWCHRERVLFAESDLRSAVWGRLMGVTIGVALSAALVVQWY